MRVLGLLAAPVVAAGVWFSPGLYAAHVADPAPYCQGTHVDFAPLPRGTHKDGDVRVRVDQLSQELTCSWPVSGRAERVSRTGPLHQPAMGTSLLAVGVGWPLAAVAASAWRRRAPR